MEAAPQLPVTRALTELNEDDREALVRCDLEGMNQADFARLHGLTLPGTESRVQRARKRPSACFTQACQVRFDTGGQGVLLRAP